MSITDIVVYAGVSAFLSWGMARALTLTPMHRLARPNYRGVNLNPVLGLAVASSGLGVILWSLASRALAGRWEDRFGVYLWVLLACALVVLAGIADDLTDGGVRGLRGHLASAMKGRFTTGAMKVLASVSAGVLVVIGLPSRQWWVMAAGVVLMAGADLPLDEGLRAEAAGMSVESPRICVVIPVFNEEENLSELCTRLRQVLEDQAIPFKLYLVERNHYWVAVKTFPRWWLLRLV